MLFFKVSFTVWLWYGLKVRARAKARAKRERTGMPPPPRRRPVAQFRSPQRSIKMTIFFVEKRRRGRRCPYETHNFEDESDYFRRSCGPLHLTSTFWVFVVSLEKNRISVRSQFSWADWRAHWDASFFSRDATKWKERYRKIRNTLTEILMLQTFSWIPSENSSRFAGKKVAFDEDSDWIANCGVSRWKLRSWLGRGPCSTLLQRGSLESCGEHREQQDVPESQIIFAMKSGSFCALLGWVVVRSLLSCTLRDVSKAPETCEIR